MLTLNFILVQTDAAKQYSRTHLMKTWHDEKQAEKKTHEQDHDYVEFQNKSNDLKKHVPKMW